MTGTLLVVYDRGAVSGAEIAHGLAGLGPVAFAVADSAHTRRVAPVLGELGRVLPLTGDPGVDLAAVRGVRPAAVLTFSERMLPVTSALAGALGLPGHGPATVRVLTDKPAQRSRLQAAGVDDVRCRAVSALDEWPAARAEVGLPAVLKPVRGEGSRHTHLVHDDATATARLAEILAAEPDGGVLVEQLLPGRADTPLGDYVSVESACGPRGTVHLAVTGKFRLVPPFREPGRYWPAALGPGEREAVVALTGRALDALGVRTGLTHTEVKLTADGPRIIEVNGRLGGHVAGLARQAAGVDVVTLAGLLALGADPAPPTGIDTPDPLRFQHNTLAPVRPCVLTAVHGASDVRRVPGVDGFRTYARPGDVLDTGVMTRHLDLLWGHAADHDEMLRVVDDATAALSYEFRFADGVRRVPATALRHGGDAALRRAEPSGHSRSRT